MIKNNKVKHCTLLIVHCTLLIVHCPLLIAQTTPLERLKKEVVDNNPELKMLTSEYRAALERAPQLSQLPDPEIGAGVFPLPVETRLGAQSFRLGATQMLPWFGTLDSKKELELAKAKALYERIAARRLELYYQVEEAYYQLYGIRQSRMIIERNVQFLESLEELARIKVESGRATLADVLRVQLKLEELQQELRILEISETNPLATLNQLLHRPAGTPVQVADSLTFAAIPFSRDTLLASIETNHPVLRMYALQQEVSRAAIQVNELNGKPMFGLGLDYIMVNQRTDMELPNNGRDILQLRATVKVPLFREQYKAKEREEQFRIQALEHQKDEVLDRFTAAIERAYADYETARLQRELYQRQQQITRSAIEILQASYSTAGSNFDELLRLERELIDYDLKMLKAIVKSHLAVSSIQRYLLE